MTEQIEPRTRSEREAFKAGYAHAILAVERGGIEEAKAFLRTIHEADERRLAFDEERNA